MRILLVEDDQDLRETVREILSRGDYTIEEATNGQDAQTMMRAKDYDLVISDAQMPLMGGIELLQWMKSEKPTPCILMTGYSEMLETKKTFELEVDNFIVKPFMNRDLVEAVREVLQQALPLHNSKKTKAV